MRRLRLIIIILRRSGAGKVLLGFLLIYLACGVVVQVAEPSVESYGDALWFLWAVSTTVGLGDFTAVSAAGRIATIICSVSAIVTTAIFTGVVVDYFNEARQHQADDSLSEFLDKLENLPKLSKQELEDLSKKVRRLRTHSRNH